MGQFQEIVDQLSSRLNEAQYGDKINPQQIPKIIGDLLRGGGQSINCYPGIPGFECQKLAFFVSLKSHRYSTVRGHLSCKEAMEKVVQHMQGSCNGITRYAIFITDSWDVDAFNGWKQNLQRIKEESCLEVYLLTGGAVSSILI